MNHLDIEIEVATIQTLLAKLGRNVTFEGSVLRVKAIKSITAATTLTQMNDWLTDECNVGISNQQFQVFVGTVSSLYQATNVQSLNVQWTDLTATTKRIDNRVTSNQPASMVWMPSYLINITNVTVSGSTGYFALDGYVLIFNR